MRYLRSRRLYALVTIALLSRSAAAQYSEMVEVRVLEIEASVLDRRGKPVDGLTRDDFVVTIVVFSTLDPSPTVAPMDEELDYKLMRDNARDSVTLLARQTGGQVIFDRNDFAQELSVLDDQVSTYYSIGVQPPASVRKNVNIAVKMKGQPKLRVLTSTRRALPSRDEAVASAIRAHLYFREEANPLEARALVGTVTHRDNRCVAPIAVEVPAERLELVPTQIDIRFAVLDDAEEESDVKTITKDVPSKRPITETLSLGLKKRKYVVSIAVVDRLAGSVSYLQRDVDCR